MIEWLIASFGALVAAVLASELLILVLNKVVKPITTRTKTTLDDWIIEALVTPIRLFGLVIGLFLTTQNFYPDKLFLERTASFWFSTALILVGGFAVARILNALILWYCQELSPEARSKIKVSRDLFPIARKLTKLAVYVATLIIVLSRFGVEITPLLTGLGIAGLAVALAVKDTLANFFAGLYLLSDKPVKVGEYIALDNEDSVVKGFVEEIGWRTTRIRTRNNYVYIIPNEKITANNVVNFSRGTENDLKKASVTISVEATDASKAADVLTDAVRRVQRRDPRVGKTEPKARLENVSKTGLTFKVLYALHNVFDAEDVASEVRKEILLELRKNKMHLA